MKIPQLKRKLEVKKYHGIEFKDEFLPYFSPSRVAKRVELSVSVMQIDTESPNSLPFL